MDKNDKEQSEVVDMWEGQTRKIYSQLFCILPHVYVEFVVEEINFSICTYKQIN